MAENYYNSVSVLNISNDFISDIRLAESADAKKRNHSGE